MAHNRQNYARHILKASSVVALNLAAIAITSGASAQSLGESVATAFGGGAAYDTGTGAFTLPSYLIRGETFDNVGGALSELNGSLTGVLFDLAAVDGATLANTLVLIDLRDGNFGPFRSDNTAGAGNPDAAGDDSTAGGFGATASAAQSLALGNSSSATAANSVALGFGSVADQANTVSVGAVGAERRIVNVDAGTLSAGSTDAVNGGQLFATNQTTANALGGGAGVDVNGNLTGPTYLIQGGSYTDVGSALGALDTGPEKGSIIMLLATDAPLDARQLRRLALRAGAGLARTGSVFGHGSGDIALAFSTAYTVPQRADAPMPVVTLLHDVLLDPLFQAAADSTEQAILHALWHAETVIGRNGHVRHALRDVRLLPTN